jgi:GAF domain-containing protein
MRIEPLMNITKEEQYDIESSSQDIWREQFLQRILILSAAVGLFALIPAVIGTSDLILQSVYIGVFVLLVAVTVMRLPYLVKAAIFVLLPLVLGIGSLTETGIRGDTLFFFLAFVTLSSLLIGPRIGVISAIIAEVVIIGMGYLILNERFTLSDKLAVDGDLTEWIIAAASYLLITLVIVTALQMLNENFNKIQQHAFAVQQSQLSYHKELENRIAERTRELSRKTNLLKATSIVTHQTTILQKLDMLLNQTVILISEHFACYHVGIYLINQRGDYLTLQAASSEGGKRLIEQGFRIRVGTESIIGYVAAEKKPRISEDVDRDIVFLDNPELVETRSELSMPLLVHNKLVGVLDLQSSEINTFRFDELEIYQSMADQIAVAVENARLLTESQFVISQLENLSSENTRQNWKSEIPIRNPIFRYSPAGVQPIGKHVPQKQDDMYVIDIPIVLRGQRIGAISLQRKTGFRKWTAQEESIANEVASQTALALENIRLVERTRERANREQAISNVSARIRESLDLDIVLRTSAREIQKALNLQEAEIRLIPQINNNDEDERKEASF